jgi:tetratricopeptide (TPR) repeat protein
VTSKNALLSNLKELMLRKEFDKVLDLIHQAEGERDLTTAELVIKGRCIQLAPEPRDSLMLSDAKDAFKGALELDPDYVPALIELAFFYFAVEDMGEKALPLFERAIEIGRSQLTESAIGKCGCLEEVASNGAAAEFLRSMKSHAIIWEKLDDEQLSWLADAARS